MVRILYDPENVNCLFSMASVLLKHEREQKIIIPTETKSLLSPKLKEVLLETSIVKFDNTQLDEFNDDLRTCDDQIIILGLRPKNKKEAAIVAQFVSDYKRQIKLWIDDKNWQPDLYNYLRLDNQNIIATNESSCLSKLQKHGYPAPAIWLRIDKALQRNDLRNFVARRYIQAIAVNQVLVNNCFNDIDSQIQIFRLAIQEIIDKQLSYEISELADMFFDMKIKTEILKDNFSDTHPIFRKAKRLGCPVGYLYLKDMERSADIKSIVELGLKKYPWLCVVVYNIKDEKYIFVKSKYIPINELLSYYGELDISINSLLKLLNAEVVNYKIKNDHK